MGKYFSLYLRLLFHIATANKNVMSLEQENLLCYFVVNYCYSFYVHVDFTSCNLLIFSVINMYHK